MTLAQWTLDAALSLEGSRGIRHLALDAVRSIRKMQLRFGDPLVSYKIGRVPLRIPLSHQLPYHRSAFPFYASNIGRIGAAVLEKYPDLSAIDIGANVGDTVAILRETAFYPVLCVEGSPTFLPLLHRNVRDLGEVEIEPAFVGAKSGSVAATLHSARGTGHLTLGNGDEGTVRLRSLEEIILDHPRFEGAKLLKSDTDGMDVQIISGAVGYLASAQPVLFFEYDPDLTTRSGGAAATVFDVLEGAGYDHALVYENTGDLMFMFALGNRELRSDLDAFFSGRNGGRYADICAFHRSDSDLALSVHRAEMEFFNEQRSIPVVT